MKRISKRFVSDIANILKKSRNRRIRENYQAQQQTPRKQNSHESKQYLNHNVSPKESVQSSVGSIGFLSLSTNLSWIGNSQRGTVQWTKVLINTRIAVVLYRFSFAENVLRKDDY